MDFKQLVHQAERNAKRQERKVHQAEREIKTRQQQQMERMAYEKAREKLTLKRRIAAMPTQQQKQQEQQQSSRKPASAPHATGTKRERAPSQTSTAGLRTDTRQPNNCDEPKFVIPKKSSAGPAFSNAACAEKLNNNNATAKPKNVTAKHFNGQVSQRQSSTAASFSSLTTDEAKGKRSRISNPEVEAQQQPKHHDRFKELMAQANQNDASTVERLIEQTDAIAAAKAERLQQQHQRRHNNKARTAPVPDAAEVGVSAGRELTYAAAVRERLARQQQEAVLDKQRRLTGTGYRLLSSEESENSAAAAPTKLTAPAMAPKKPPVVVQKLPQQQHQQKANQPMASSKGAAKMLVTHKQREQRTTAATAVLTEQAMSWQSNGTSSSSSSFVQKQQQQQQQKRLSPPMMTTKNNNDNNKAMRTTSSSRESSNNNKMVMVSKTAKTTTTSANSTTSAKKSMQPPAPQQQSQQQIAATASAVAGGQVPPPLPQKRFLPGDIRYRGGPTATAPVQSNKKAAPSNVLSTQHQTMGESSKKKLINGTTHNRQHSLSASSTKLAMAELPVSKKMLEKGTKVDVNAALDRSRARELELEAQLREEREKVARILAKANEAEATRQKRGDQPQQMPAAERRPKNHNSNNNNMVNNNNNCVNSTGSLARIKREAQLRREMAMTAHRRDRPVTSSSSRKYANYSETDEDEEEEEDNYEDDEYDSDMADFIDDSMVDDLQREDFEETLKIINPRYNKEKWLARERMIDERRMDARFRDVEAEERHSSRLGLVEDLREAKRGSKALG